MTHQMPIAHELPPSGEAPHPHLDWGSYQTYTNLNLNLKPSTGLGYFAVITSQGFVPHYLVLHGTTFSYYYS
jgi:hypothetical protein